MTRRSVEHSNLSLLGLVRHLAAWSRAVLVPPGDGGAGTARHYRPNTDSDGDFDGAVPDPEVVTEAWETWRAEVAFAEQFVAEAPGLDVTGDYDYGPGYEPGSVSLREVLVHMIEEYARHNGHADFLRERIDGRVETRSNT